MIRLIVVLIKQNQSYTIFQIEKPKIKKLKLQNSIKLFKMMLNNKIMAPLNKIYKSFYQEIKKYIQEILVNFKIPKNNKVFNYMSKIKNHFR